MVCFVTDSSDIWSAGRIKRIIEDGNAKLVVLDPRVKPEGYSPLMTI